MNAKIIANASFEVFYFQKMQLKSYKQIIILFSFTVVTLVAYLFFVRSSYFDSFSGWAQHNFILFFIILVVIKIIGIVWPPINGGLLTLGSIPVIGWLPAYLADLIGSTIGSTIAYYIAKRFGLLFMKNIFDEETITQVQKIKVKPIKEFEAIFLSRMFGGSIVEVICYGAGLLNVRFSRYLPASILSHAVVGVPFYFFAGDIIAGRNFIINGTFAVILIVLFMFARHRYIDITE
jgi:uncharacterized membrane protein YdjX (TVP38/TMEM64 family)